MFRIVSRKPGRRSFLIQARLLSRCAICRPLIEPLEGRHLLATITVTGTGDTIAVDGLVTLREAITSANNNANVNADVVAVGAYGQDTINFNISGAGVKTISPATALPTITDPVTIDGYTQPGASTNTLPGGDNAVLLIELNGTSAGGGSAGLIIGGGIGSTVQGLVINRFAIGIEIGGTSSATVVRGNFIGTDAGGTVDLGNSLQGIEIASSTGNTIGGTSPAARNVISGNAFSGVLIQGPPSTNNFVQGNFIGTDVTGTLDLGNTGEGVAISNGASANRIGGTATGAGNVLSGNGFAGVHIIDDITHNNIVEGNLIGTNAAGTAAIPNSFFGVRVTNAFNNTIGGVGAGAGNVIANNERAGVEIFSDPATGNAILGNSIFSNTDLGIDLGDDGVTPNDTLDPDEGPNNLQNFPVLTSVTQDATTTTFQGTLNSLPNTSFRIEFFSNVAGDPSGFGEGQHFVGFTTVTTNASGNATFNFSELTQPGTAFTATATRLGAEAVPIETSEFSAVVQLAAAAADLALIKIDSPDPVTAGQNLTYTITLANNGPSDAGQVSLIDAIPANTTFVSFSTAPGFAPVTPAVGSTGTIFATNLAFAAGGTAIFTLVVNVNPTATLTVTNTANLQGAINDPIASNNSATATTTIVASQPAAADLSITKTDSPDPVAAGNNLTYTITVTNAGPSSAQGLSLSDAIPTNTTFVSFTAPAGWTNTTPTVGGTGTVTSTRSTLAAGGAPQVFTLVVKANPSLAAGSIVTNTANVTTTTTDTNPPNNSATTTTAVVVSADIAVTKTDTPGTIAPGENLTYTLVVRNNGPSDAQGVSLTDAIPANTTFVSATQNSGPSFTLTTPPVGGTGNFTATTATLAAGASATFTLVVLVDSEVTGGTTISNTATVSTTTSDVVTTNNTAAATSQVAVPGQLVCEVTTLNEPGSLGSAVLVNDADNPGQNVLIVTGTGGNDVIVIEPRPFNSSQIRVKRNGVLVGLFTRSAVQHIVAFGLAGNDKLIVNATLTQPATLLGGAGNDELYSGRGADALDGGAGNDRLFGGAGNDTLCGGDGNDDVYGQAGNDLLGGDAGNDRLWGEAGNDLLLGASGNDKLYGGIGNDRLFGQTGNDQLFGENGSDILVAGAGNDTLIGGTGRDLLIGGDGNDLMAGETHDDILVAGSTVHDEDEAALQAILAEWTSNRNYITRVNNIRFGGGANGAFTLDSATVLDDRLVDTLIGNSDLDWFLFGAGDKLKDKVSRELVN